MDGSWPAICAWPDTLCCMRLWAAAVPPGPGGAPKLHPSPVQPGAAALTGVRMCTACGTACGAACRLAASGVGPHPWLIYLGKHSACGALFRPGGTGGMAGAPHPSLLHAPTSLPWSATDAERGGGPRGVAARRQAGAHQRPRLPRAGRGGAAGGALAGRRGLVPPRMRQQGCARLRGGSAACGAGRLGTGRERRWRAATVPGWMRRVLAAAASVGRPAWLLVPDLTRVCPLPRLPVSRPQGRAAVLRGACGAAGLPGQGAPVALLSQCRACHRLLLPAVPPEGLCEARAPTAAI